MEDAVVVVFRPRPGPSRPKLVLVAGFETGANELVEDPNPADVVASIPKDENPFPPSNPPLVLGGRLEEEEGGGGRKDEPLLLAAGLLAAGIDPNPESKDVGTEDFVAEGVMVVLPRRLPTLLPFKLLAVDARPAVVAGKEFTGDTTLGDDAVSVGVGAFAERDSEDVDLLLGAKIDDVVGTVNPL